MAPTSTEERWFTAEHEWKAANFDYAVACWSTDYIRRDISLHDHSESHFDLESGASVTFLDIHEEYCAGYGPFFTLTDDILVFSDVDQSNPDHEKELRAKIASTKPLGQPTEQSNAVKEKLVQHLRKSRHDSVRSSYTASMPLEVREFDLRKAIENPTGAIPRSVLDFITHLDSREEKHEALMLASGQAYLPPSIQRPVILLVSVVDTAQTTTIGESAGYIAAYDILADKLIIKPYVSNDTRHFLADNWFADLPPADDIAFTGTPMDFVRKCLAFAHSLTAADAASPPTEASGFKYLVWADVAEWLWYHSPALSSTDKAADEEDRTLIAEFEQCCRSRELKQKFQDLPFPVQEKKKKEAEGMGEGKEKDELDWQVEACEQAVADYEWGLRLAAKEAMGEEGKAGKAKAKAAARLWDRVTEAFEKFAVEAKMLGVDG
ncbi:MAG: hypothetical protein Q9185_004859 [Variospora sp. 1 TL-2023]